MFPTPKPKLRDDYYINRHGVPFDRGLRRALKHLSKSQLATICGVTRQTVNGWASIPEDHAGKVARFLNMKPIDVCPSLKRIKR